MKIKTPRVLAILALVSLAGMMVIYWFLPSKVVEVHSPGPTPLPGPRIALVLDDVGYGQKALLKRAVAMPVPCTFAVIPFSDKDEESSQIVSQSGNQFIIHLPMPSPDTDVRKDYPGGIDTGMSQQEIAEVMEINLSRVRGAVGVNNHQGSLGTADEELMGLLFTFLKSRNLFFLDSRTTRHTVAPKLAREWGIRFAQRSVFLDNESEPASIRRQLQDLMKQAKRKGQAVGIGHLKDTTVAVLEEELPGMLAEGYEFVFVSQLVEKFDLSTKKTP